MTRTFKAFWLFSVLALALPACNEGLDGFIAPDGSTVEMPGDSSVKVSTEFYYITTTMVRLPDNEPGNKIQVSFLCTYCEILDAADGGDVNAALARNDLIEVSNPFITQTGRNGTRTVVVRVQSPAFWSIAESYQATLSADIGVAGGQMAITVESF